MLPPVYQVLTASSAVTAIAGARIYGSGQATQEASQPYVVWQIVSMVPENTLSCVADSDNFRVQIDCYAESEPVAKNLAIAVRNAIEGVADIALAWNGYENGTDQQPSTALYRWSMDAIWMIER